MIALDSTVIVRYLVMDDEGQQCEAARAVVDAALEAGESVFVSQVVLCEVAGVLATVYEQRRDTIRATLWALASSRNVVVEGLDEVHRALEAHEAGAGDLADYVIAERARAAGCSEVVTFDRGLAEERGFRAI